MALSTPAERNGAILAPLLDLSRHNREFLDFADENPEAMDRFSFAALQQKSEFAKYPLQSWPTFVRRDLVEEMGRATVGITELIKSLPERHFGFDPQRLSAYYRLDPSYAALLGTLLSDREHLGGLLARGDFVKTADGFRCLEVNMSSNLGGWKATFWAEMYARVPLIQRFLAERSIHYTHRDAVLALFSHLIARARDRKLVDRELNVAFLVPAGNRSARAVQEFGGERWAEILLLQTGARGRLSVCDLDDLTSRNGCLYLRDQRIHILLDHHDGRVDAKTFRPMVTGTLNVYNGPSTQLFADKRNLALLSEFACAPCFDAAEQALITAYVPWTRAVGPGSTSFRGEKVQIPSLLADRREELVLKPAGASQGVGVHVGRAVSGAEWNAAAEEALAKEGTWVVQEHVDSLPYLMQAGERGCAEHDLVWGFLVFGSTYGGGFLRMSPKGGSGVVNAARGASEGVILEVAE
jgi:hypothetical protein